ncbi:phosphoribosyltransferase-like protein [Syncephalis fuscata]|nr:phosphoribosyltransferase-like protein [Syncephalis fuscata]
MRNIVVISGSSNPELAESICSRLGVRLGNVKLSKFSNQETNVEIFESVRDKDVYIIQSGCGRVNDNLVELIIMLGACKTASAKRVTAVIPCFPYARQPDAPHRQGRSSFYHRLQNGDQAQYIDSTSDDFVNKLSEERDAAEAGLVLSPDSDHMPDRKPTVATTTFAEEATTTNPKDNGYKQWPARPGTLIADMLTSAGADHIITMDLHDPQFQGFFDVPVDVVYAQHTILDYIRHHIPHWRDAVVVSPDAGGAKRATQVANYLNLDFALIHREGMADDASRMALVGDVRDKTAIIIDDIADTCRTLCLATDILCSNGASKVYAIVTHPMLSGRALEILNKSPLSRVVVTNTIPIENKREICSKLEVIDISGTFSEAIRRSHNGESLSQMFA